MLLKKDAILFARDDKGKLVPQEVPLVIDDKDTEQVPHKGKEVVIIPMCRGEVKRLFSAFDKEGDDKDKDLDKEIITKYFVNPSFTEEDVEAMIPSYSSMLVNTVMYESGLSSGNKKKAVDKKEDEFAKNWIELGLKGKKAT